MFDALGALVITFVVMSVISVIGVALLYLAKSEKVKKGMFYFLTVWGMVIAYCNVLGNPPLWVEEIMLAWGLGGLSAVALLVQLCLKKENKFKIARILVTISVAAGMIDCFMF
uniref:hypothetical protein n=1 Tax=Agathobacter sp. TaxID=2021311 RepID=UPI004057373B